MGTGWIILLLAAAATFGTTALFVLFRAVKSGAFEGIEDTKFVVFRDDEDFEDEAFDDEPPQ